MGQPEHEPPCLQAGLFPFDVVIHTVDSATALGYSLNTSDVSLGMQSLYSKARSVIVGCLHVPLLPACLHPPVHPHPPCSHHQPLRRLPPAAALDPACRPVWVQLCLAVWAPAAPWRHAPRLPLHHSLQLECLHPSSEQLLTTQVCTDTHTQTHKITLTPRLMES